MAKKRLDLLVAELGLVSSRQKAQAEIMAGNVLVHETPVTKPGTAVDESAVIRLKESFPYVSRGALKLIHALDYFHVEAEGRTAVDVGSSTGGFTEVLLERGASKVYAVDSGTNQLDWKLRSDPRVVTLENTNARYIDRLTFEPAPDLAVMDVSFISVTKILPALVKVLRPPYEIVVLIKPQFELEKGKIGKKGLVKEEFREEAVESVVRVAASIGLATGETVESPITGSKSGNVEFLTLFRSGR